MSKTIHYCFLIGICLFLVLAPFRHHTQAFKSIAFGFMCLGLVLQCLTDREALKALLRSPIIWSLLGLTLVFVVSNLNSHYPEQSWRSFRKDWVKWIVLFLSIFCWADKRKALWVVASCVLAGAVTTIGGLSNYFIDGGWDIVAERLGHSFDLVHVGLGRFLVVCLPFSLFLPFLINMINGGHWLGSGPHLYSY